MAHKKITKRLSFDEKTSLVLENVNSLHTYLLEVQQETRNHDYWTTPEAKDLLHSAADAVDDVKLAVEELYDDSGFIDKIVNEGDEEIFSSHLVLEHVNADAIKDNFASDFLDLRSFSMDQKQALNDFLKQLFPLYADQNQIGLPL